MLALLVSCDYKISARTVLRCRKTLRWTLRGSAYCQLIRDVNKVKRLALARANLNNSFDDVILPKGMRHLDEWRVPYPFKGEEAYRIPYP